jgi:hypothetical protein
MVRNCGARELRRGGLVKLELSFLSFEVINVSFLTYLNALQEVKEQEDWMCTHHLLRIILFSRNDYLLFDLAVHDEEEEEVFFKINEYCM